MSATVDVVRKQGGVEEVVKQESIPTDAVDGPHLFGRVRVGTGQTINTGNFESFRIDVAIEVPFKFSKDNAEKAFGWAKAWVQKRLEVEVAEIGG